MSKFGSKQIIPLATAALAVLWIFVGLTTYGFWDEIKGPTPGFVPTIVAVLMLAISLLSFSQSFKEEKPSYPRGNWLVVLAGAGIYISSMLVGMLLSLAIYVVVWLKVVEKTPWKTTLIIFAVIMAIVFGVFVFWLGVPFPIGMLFEAILR